MNVCISILVANSVFISSNVSPSQRTGFAIVLVLFVAFALSFSVIQAIQAAIKNSRQASGPSTMQVTSLKMTPNF
jgi:hypothetical protein